MEAILEKLHRAEPHRIGGWGIDQADLYTEIGDSFVAWIWLIGDDLPSSQAQAIAAQHPDVQIRTGASATYAQLQSAQHQFAEGRGTFLPHDNFDDAVKRFELSDAIAWTWIDLRSNALEIAVDSTRIPREVASLMLTGDPDYYGDSDGLPMAELPDKIAAEIQHLIDIPFVVIDRRSDPDG